MTGTDEVGPVEQIRVFNGPVDGVGGAVPEPLESDVVRGGATGAAVLGLHAIAGSHLARHSRGV